MRFVVAGLTHRTAPLAVREAAAVPETAAPTVLRYLVGHGGFHAAAVLSTCNRTEFYVTCPDDDADDVPARIAPWLDPGGHNLIARHLFVLHGDDAVRHLMRVAAGLESMVVGEHQVLGQLKDAIKQAQEAGTLDARLDFVLRRAVTAGKRVRSETDLGRHAGNLAEAAVDHLRAGLTTFGDRPVLLVGAGAMAELAARRLAELGCEVIAASRGDSRHRVAAAVGGRAVAAGALLDVAAEVDSIICCTRSEGHVLSESLLRSMQQDRAGRPLCIVDMAVPRDVAPGAASVPGVTIADIDELGRQLEGTQGSRRHAIAEAESVVAQEVRRTMAVIGQRDSAAPTITALLRHAETIRR
ncbi:MAG: glutamyl-tRNA reductase, partial [Candidatus Dormibacteraeota bacterium]|nr:glutamyl-tRNA reductase [Candidatus Dormibacteraeota bacterium]